MIFFFNYPFRYSINLLYSFHCRSFPFLRDADSRRGTLCPFCVPIHKKKKKEKKQKAINFPGEEDKQLTVNYSIMTLRGLKISGNSK